MKYKIRKYRKCLFETYVPKKRVELTKEDAVPLVVRICNRFLVLGGIIGFFISSLFVGILGFFGIRRRVRNFRFNRKIIEIRVKK